MLINNNLYCNLSIEHWDARHQTPVPIPAIFSLPGHIPGVLSMTHMTFLPVYHGGRDTITPRLSHCACPVPYPPPTVGPPCHLLTCPFGPLSVLVRLEAGVEMGLERQVLVRVTPVERRGRVGQWKKGTCCRAMEESQATSTHLPWIRTTVLEGKLAFICLFGWNELCKTGAGRSAWTMMAAP